MAINLKEHAIFIDRLQMDMVPLSIAEKAVQESVESIDDAMKNLEQALIGINKTIADNE